jgi:hypothetical protein
MRSVIQLRDEEAKFYGQMQFCVVKYMLEAKRKTTTSFLL